MWFLCIGVAIIFGAQFGVAVKYNSKIIPQRVTLTYLNPEYVDFANITVKRYGRNSEYYINVIGSIKHAWGNNITLTVYFFEYLHNEYKRTFVEMSWMVCDMLNNDPYAGKAFMNAGIPKCPVPPGVWKLMNITFPVADFPYKWPFEKAKVECKAETTQMKNKPAVLIGALEANLLFKQTIRKESSKPKLNTKFTKYGE